MVTLRCAVIAFLIFLSGCVASGGRLDGFRSLSTTDHGYQIVSNPVRLGDAAQRFEVRAGDCARQHDWDDCKNDRERSEISLRDHIQVGEERWIGFSVYLPPDFPTSSKVNTTVGQIHQKGGPSGTAGGLPSFPPLLQLEMRGDRYAAKLATFEGPRDNIRENVRYHPISRVSDMKGKWTDIEMRLRTEVEPVFELYANGELQVRTTALGGYTPQSYYIKYGLYRSFVSRHGAPMPTQIAIFDEVKMGPTRESIQIDPDSPVD